MEAGDVGVAVSKSMRLAALAGLLLTIAGCTTAQPGSTTEGAAWLLTARVPSGGQSAALDQGRGEANTFCASQGRVAQLVSNTSQECALHGGCVESQIVFRCVKASN